MRVLCCLDGFNIEQIGTAVSSLVNADTRVIGLLFVRDSGPHDEMKRKREGLLRPNRPSGPLRERMQQAEVAAAEDIMQEGLRYFAGAETIQREGRPEREIVNCAVEWNADCIVICPHSPQSGVPALGPRAGGNVASFVLDHAPCAVLLARTVTREGFPLQR